jgi:hypothetical protein
VEAWLQEEEDFCRAYDAAADGRRIVAEHDDARYEDDRECACFDIGITSAVCCLCALGAMPFVSCSGGWPFAPHREHYPLVGFFADPVLLSAFVPFARSRDVGLENTEPGGALLYAPSIPRMVGFVRSVFNDRAALGER